MGFFSWISGLFHHNPAPIPTPAPVQTGGNMAKALLVGINRYPGCPLQGCVNDVLNMKAYIMQKFGFTEDQICVLTDEAATTANILAKLEWLIDVKPGDRVLFHYSGHGATFYTGRADKPSGVSEVICPVDFDWSPAHMITDQTFVQVFSRIPMGAIFNWVSDSCHSGGLDRDMPEQVPSHGFFGFFKTLWNKVAFWKPIPAPIVGKSFPVPLAIHSIVSTARMAGPSKSITGGILDVGFIAGCRSDQTSADTQDPNGVPCGALTYFLVKNMKALPDLTSVTDIVAHVNADLRQNGYSQNPQAEGGRASRPFLNA